MIRSLNDLPRRTLTDTILGLLVAIVSMLVIAASASAAPIMQVFSSSNTTAAPGSQVTYYLSVQNVGDEATLGELTLQARFPAGLTAVSGTTFPWDCSGTTFPASTVTCTYSGSQDPFKAQPPLEARATSLKLTVSVDPGASGVLTSSFALSGVPGSNVTPVSTVDPITITPTLPGFGIDAFDSQVTADTAGDPLTQAGGRPYADSTTVFFNTIANPVPLHGDLWPVEAAKDVTVDLPPGFLGNPTAATRCTQAELVAFGAGPQCPPGSQVGVTTIFSAAGVIIGNPVPVFNLVPPPNVPARFAFNVLGNVVTLDATLRSGGDYGATINIQGIPEGLATAGTMLTLWGVPADPAHDLERSCQSEPPPSEGGPHCTTEAPPPSLPAQPNSMYRR
jgi:uncharacterized repeat protein (TIGR01451 family)